MKSKDYPSFFISIVLTFILSFYFSFQVNASIFNPTTTLELIDAINTANTNTENDAINLVPGMVYTITGMEPGVPFVGVAGNNGLPIILSDGGNTITINGNGATIRRSPTLFTDPQDPCSGAGLEFRIFELNTGAELILNDLTLRNGCAPDGGAIFSFANDSVITVVKGVITNNSAVEGGGIITLGDLNLTQTQVTHNSALTASAGGIGIIGNVCTLNLIDSNISNNEAGSAGGILVQGATANITGTTISSNNTTSAGGAGIANVMGDVTVTGSTISNNISTHPDGVGGGIFNTGGPLNVDHSVISENEANGGGAGIANVGSTMITITYSEISDNMANSGPGGGISNTMGGNLEISDTTISGNEASLGGGGIFTGDGILALNSSTVSGNTGTAGGGGIVNIRSDLNIINTTISGNDSNRQGGGILNADGALVLTFSTITDNISNLAGGGLSLSVLTADIKNSIIAGNTSPMGANCIELGSVIVNDNGGNISDDDAANDVCNVFFNPAFSAAAMLGPLGNNGGATPTHALIPTAGPSNPAIDLIALANCTDQQGAPAPVTYDQRGFQRPFPNPGNCDSGAFELQALNVNIPIPTLSEWGLIAMAGILGIVGFMVIRRRKVTS